MATSKTIAMLVVVILSAVAIAQDQHAPLTAEQVIKLLEGGVTSKRTSALVDEYGIAFRLSTQLESRIREAGGGDDLIQIIKEMKRPLYCEDYDVCLSQAKMAFGTQWSKALYLLEDAAELKPGMGEPYDGIGDIMLVYKQYEDAVAAFELAWRWNGPLTFQMCRERNDGCQYVSLEMKNGTVSIVDRNGKRLFISRIEEVQEVASQPQVVAGGGAGRLHIKVQRQVYNLEPIPYGNVSCTRSASMLVCDSVGFKQQQVISGWIASKLRH